MSMTPEESNSPKQQPTSSSDEFSHLAANLDHFRRSCFEQVKSFTLPSTISIALFQEREEALRFAKEVAARVLQQPDAKVYAWASGEQWEAQIFQKRKLFSNEPEEDVLGTVLTNKDGDVVGFIFRAYTEECDWYFEECVWLEDLNGTRLQYYLEPI